MSDAGFSMMDLFREEVRAHTASLNDGLLRLESQPADSQAIEPLMRAAHSIKGAARIVGIDLAVKLAHAMEDAFVAAQQGRIQISQADVDVFLQGTDVLGSLALLEGEDTTDWAVKHEAAVTHLAQALHAVAQR